ncbi:MAG: hypothetical protein HC876_12940 [Chloroflexaceae bacterium]|nr:hypothetical protein [Chloroflexaceae bacterium]
MPGCYDDWLLERRETVTMHYTNLLHTTCQALLVQQRTREALPLAQRLLQQEPLNEVTLRMLMRLYVSLGQRNAALTTYEQFVSLIRQELAIEPEVATRTLAETLRSGRASAPNTSTDVHPPSVWLPPTAAISVSPSDATPHHFTMPPITPTHREGQKGLLHALETSDRPGECAALLQVAHEQAEQGNLSAALVSVQQALQTAHQHGAPELFINGLLLKSQLLQRQGLVAEALLLLREAHTLAQTHQLCSAIGQSLWSIAHFQEQSGLWHEAIQTYQQARVHWRDAERPAAEARTLTYIAVLQKRMGQAAAALALLDTAQGMYEQLNDPLGIAQVWHYQAVALLAQSTTNTGNAIQIARRAIACFQITRCTEWEATTSCVLGQALWLDQQPHAALTTLEHAVLLLQPLKKPAWLAEALAYQGLVLCDLQQPLQARRCTDQALMVLAQQCIGRGWVVVT